MPGSSAKRTLQNTIIQPAGVKSAAVLAQAHIGQSRTNGTRSLRKGSEKIDRRTRPFLSARDTRISIRMPRDRWHRTPRRRSSRTATLARHDAGFSSGASKNSYSHGPFLSMRIPPDVPRSHRPTGETAGMRRRRTQLRVALRPSGKRSSHFVGDVNGSKRIDQLPSI